MIVRLLFFCLVSIVQVGGENADSSATKIVYTSDYVIHIQTDVDEKDVCKVNRRFLSLAFSIGNLNKTFTGYDIDSKKLKNLLSALSPSYIRIGGTKANFVYFQPRQIDSSGSTDNVLPETTPTTTTPAPIPSDEDEEPPVGNTTPAPPKTNKPDEPKEKPLPNSDNQPLTGSDNKPPPEEDNEDLDTSSEGLKDTENENEGNDIPSENGDETPEAEFDNEFDSKENTEDDGAANPPQDGGKTNPLQDDLPGESPPHVDKNSGAIEVPLKERKKKKNDGKIKIQDEQTGVQDLPLASEKVPDKDNKQLANPSSMKGNKSNKNKQKKVGDESPDEQLLPPSDTKDPSSGPITSNESEKEKSKKKKPVQFGDDDSASTPLSLKPEKQPIKFDDEDKPETSNENMGEKTKQKKKEKKKKKLGSLFGDSKPIGDDRSEDKNPPDILSPPVTKPDEHDKNKKKKKKEPNKYNPLNQPDDYEDKNKPDNPSGGDGSDSLPPPSTPPPSPNGSPNDLPKEEKEDDDFGSTYPLSPSPPSSPDASPNDLPKEEKDGDDSDSTYPPSPSPPSPKGSSNDLPDKENDGENKTDDNTNNADFNPGNVSEESEQKKKKKPTNSLNDADSEDLTQLPNESPNEKTHKTKKKEEKKKLKVLDIDDNSISNSDDYEDDQKKMKKKKKPSNFDDDNTADNNGLPSELPKEGNANDNPSNNPDNYQGVQKKKNKNKNKKKMKQNSFDDINATDNNKLPNELSEEGNDDQTKKEKKKKKMNDFDYDNPINNPNDYKDDQKKIKKKPNNFEDNYTDNGLPGKLPKEGNADKTIKEKKKKKIKVFDDDNSINNPNDYQDDQRRKKKKKPNNFNDGGGNSESSSSKLPSELPDDSFKDEQQKTPTNSISDTNSEGFPKLPSDSPKEETDKKKIRQKNKKINLSNDENPSSNPGNNTGDQPDGLASSSKLLNESDNSNIDNNNNNNNNNKRKKKKAKLFGEDSPFGGNKKKTPKNNKKKIKQLTPVDDAFLPTPLPKHIPNNRNKKNKKKNKKLFDEENETNSMDGLTSLPSIQTATTTPAPPPPPSPTTPATTTSILTTPHPITTPIPINMMIPSFNVGMTNNMPYNTNTNNINNFGARYRRQTDVIEAVKAQKKKNKKKKNKKKKKGKKKNPLDDPDLTPEEKEKLFKELKKQKFLGYRPYKMTADLFDDLYCLFVTETKNDIIFDVNAFPRTPTGLWDPTNAIQLMEYVKQKKYKIDWQLGNEPNHYKKLGDDRVLSGAQVGADYVMFEKILSTLKYGNPRIIGPDTTRPQKNKKVSEWLGDFLSQAKKSINVLSWHQYYENGRTVKPEQFLDPKTLNKFVDQCRMMKAVARDNKFRKPIWITETGSAWGGGAANISNRYVAGFPYLDKLGVAAQYCMKVVARQTFLAGKYAMIDKDTYRPHPDYYLAALFKRLVGRIVLRTGVQTANDKTGRKRDDRFRVYAHCARNRRNTTPGAITAYILNLHDTDKKFAFKGYEVMKIEQYILTADDLQSDTVKLNDEPLEMNGDNLPSLEGQVVDQPVTIPKHSFGFFVIDTAVATVCT